MNHCWYFDYERSWRLLPQSVLQGRGLIVCIDVRGVTMEKAARDGAVHFLSGACFSTLRANSGSSAQRPLQRASSSFLMYACDLGGGLGLVCYG